MRRSSRCKGLVKITGPLFLQLNICPEKKSPGSLQPFRLSCGLILQGQPFVFHRVTPAAYMMRVPLMVAMALCSGHCAAQLALSGVEHTMLPFREQGKYLVSWRATVSNGSGNVTLASFRIVWTDRNGDGIATEGTDALLSGGGNTTVEVSAWLPDAEARSIRYVVACSVSDTSLASFHSRFPVSFAHLTSRPVTSIQASPGWP